MTIHRSNISNEQLVDSLQYFSVQVAKNAIDCHAQSGKTLNGQKSELKNNRKLRDLSKKELLRRLRLSNKK